MTPPHDSGIINEVNLVTTDIKTMSKEDAIKKGLLIMIDSEIDEPYFEMVQKESLRPELIKNKAKDLKLFLHLYMVLEHLLLKLYLRDWAFQ